MNCFQDKSLENYFNLSQDHRIFKAYGEVLKVKKKLCTLGLNLVIAESVTSGLIASMITDIPGMGFCFYGSFVVYDTNSKRKILGVDVEDVYTQEAAIQMAVGALNKSEAAISLSVTGHSMTRKENFSKMGVVDVAVAARLPGNKCMVFTEHLNLRILEPELKPLIKRWSTWEGYPPLKETRLLSKLIRSLTVKYSLKFLNRILESIHSQNLDMHPGKYM